MNRLIRIAPLLLLGTGVAFAQTPPEGSAQAAPEAAKPETKAPEAGGTPGQLDVDGSYTIKNGDTLWDLSQQFLNNPWYWPKIWADNPAVENPHWIFPGNRLKISRKAAGLPGEVAPAGEASASGDTEEQSDDSQAYTSQVAKKPDEELADVSQGQIEGPKKGSDAVTVGGTAKHLNDMPNTTKIHVASIVTERQLADAGVIVSSFEQRGYLQQFDRVYLKMPNLENVKIGDVYTVFRPGPEIKHPKTGKLFGHESLLMGTVKIISKDDKMAIGELGAITDAIERGDLVAQNASLDKTIKLTPNDADVTGVVLAAHDEGMTITADHHVVFIDRGSADGVKDGNTLTVLESGDGLDPIQLPGELVTDKPGPKEEIASLVVFSVSEHSSATVIVKSTREVIIGDTVVMRKAAAGSGGD